MLRLLPRKPVRIDLSEGGYSDAISLRRRRSMADIMALNASATTDFLDQFDDAALVEYLNHLSLTNQPRGTESRWVRPHGKSWAFAAAACA